MGVQIVNYFIVSPNIVIEEVWETEIYAKCDPSKLNDAFAKKSLLQTGLIAIGFGAAGDGPLKQHMCLAG